MKNITKDKKKKEKKREKLSKVTLMMVQIPKLKTKNINNKEQDITWRTEIVVS
jgi:hypothetical protein